MALLNPKKYTRTIGGREITIELGKMAQLAGGSAFVSCGGTQVLVTACMNDKPKEGIDFFPLTVDYEEKIYAAGRIPGSFNRREGRPSEKAILTSRLIDRPIRPLFPENFYNDVQIIATALSSDGENQIDMLAMLGASVALELSNVPFEGPIAGVRVGRIDDKFVINPTYSENNDSKLDIVVAGTKDAILMVEAGAEIIPENIILESIELAHKMIGEFCDWQREIVQDFGAKPKFVIPAKEENLLKGAIDGYHDKLIAVIFGGKKEERSNNLKLANEEIKQAIKGNFSDIDDAAFKKLADEALAHAEENIVRSALINEGKRVDGRKLDEIRPLYIEIGTLARTHGSALFTRGETQVLSITTLGAPGDAQELDGISPEKEKSYIHHYNFPAYSTGEAKQMRGTGRREVGHGALAERALIPVLPEKKDFGYTIRVVSEAISSNGSTSMASTCGSTLSLMDAGVPIKDMVAGVAMGLVVENGKFAVLTDIQGIEDHLGDMDFKVTGTRTGITALQMDIKVKGITLEIMKTALSDALKGRLFLLDKMSEVISEPRLKVSPYAPSMITMSIPVDKIGAVIGPGGKTIKEIIANCECQIDISDDGTVVITALNSENGERAKEIIESMTKEIEVGKLYTGTVVRLMDFGAFVQIAPGKDGLVHISKLSQNRVEKVSDIVKVGDKVKVKVSEIDQQGRINLTMKDI
jgi:polyribonucleotide nucleotidyltransferase